MAAYFSVKLNAFFPSSQITPITLWEMSQIIRFRGRDYGDEDFQFIQKLIDEHPHMHRRQLSVKLCEVWGWYQANGATRDMVCRTFMLQLHRAGVINLPAPRRKSVNPLANRKRCTGDLLVKGFHQG